MSDKEKGNIMFEKGLEKKDVEYIKRTLLPITKNVKVQKMRKYRHHGRVSTYEHGKNVAIMGYLLNKQFHIKANNKEILAAGFLHDFFLYDWHDSWKTNVAKGLIHGYGHAEIAMKNAIKYFDINEREQYAIYCHMWPLNVTRIPKTKEAWIVCVADKCCTLIESLLR